LTHILFFLANSACHSMAPRAERMAQRIKAPQLNNKRHFMGSRKSGISILLRNAG
jgi:hypothetical protein